MSSAEDDLRFRRPTLDDGLAIHQLIAACPPLDLNSVYSYFLFGAHFPDTSIVAQQGDKAVGFVSGYRIPERPDTLFVWQVAVHPQSRGQRIAWRMLDSLLHRDENRDLRCLETTVSPDNRASRALFERLAKDRGSALSESEFLAAAAFGPEAHHEAEPLLRIPLHP
jgi:L-2,4-diaminobutyric acid acetyltransferase